MDNLDTISIETRDSFPKFASEGLLQAQRLFTLPSFVNILQSSINVFPIRTTAQKANQNILPIAPPRRPGISDIIIVSLSYPEKHFMKSGRCMELVGTKFDLFLLLNHFDYRHGGGPIKFTIVNDFDIDFEDSAGVRRVIPSVDASRDSIMRKIQTIMSTVGPGDKIAFFFSGHGGCADVSVKGLRVGDDCDFQCIIAGDGQNIYGDELRSWFCEARYSSVAVTAVFDSSDSAGSMGLPYSYSPKGKTARSFRGSQKVVPIPMVQISAAQKGQYACSRRFADGYYGQLIYCLIQYLKDTNRPTMEGLVGYLDANCDPTGEQVPQVCASSKITGEFPIF